MCSLTYVLFFTLSRNSETRISSSTDHLNDVDTPVLRSFRKNRLQGQTKGIIQQATEEAQSGAFVENSTHQVRKGIIKSYFNVVRTYVRMYVHVCV